MDVAPSPSLAANFSRYFKVELAESANQKAQVFKIRYRVYCEEFNYEPLGRFTDGLESDDYDSYSRHCLITHLPTGMPAGCVRLVPAIADRETEPLPLEKYCGSSLNNGVIDSLKLRRDTVCEISRLAVDGAFRRRVGEGLTRFGEIGGLELSHQELRTFSSIAVACFFAATVLTELDKRTNVFAMMEPFLPRLMHRSGIDFQSVGRDIDYHGVRAPYFITTQEVLVNMHPELLELYQWIKANIVGKS